MGHCTVPALIKAALKYQTLPNISIYETFLTASLGSGGPRNSFDDHDDEETGSFENTIKALDPDIEIALMVMMMMRGQGVFRTL